MANLIYRLFGSTKDETAVALTPREISTLDPSTTELAVKHNTMISAFSAKETRPTPQKSLKRKHSATADLYDKVVYIEVGNTQDDTRLPRVFEIHGGLLCKHSGYFKKELGNTNEQVERRHFEFPEHEPEIFRYITLWMYTGFLYDKDETGSKADSESPLKKARLDIDLTESTRADKGSIADDNEPPVEKVKLDIDLAESTRANKGIDAFNESDDEDDKTFAQENIQPNIYDSDLTIVGDVDGPFVLVDSDEDAGISPVSTEYCDVVDIPYVTRTDCPPQLPMEPTDVAQPHKMVKPDTEALEPAPSVPIDILTLTKLYILAQALELPTLCNHVITLISRRLQHDKKILINALAYAFERSKRNSYICRVLVDYTARFACIDEILGNAEAGELSKELLVDLLSELCELRGSVGGWDEVGDVRMYKLPVRQF